jgi:[acyl-carrier-protein] S-malonyltransferase
VKEYSADVIKDALIRQVSGAVRWIELIENMIKDKIDTFVEVGAGNVLTGLVRKINKDVNVFNISTVEDLDKLES